MEGLTGPERYALTNQLFYERTAAHFDLLWRRYLDDNARTVLVMLGLVELGGIIQDREFSFGEIEQPQRFTPELRKLEKLGFVERANEGLHWDSDYLLLWEGQRWRVATGGFVLWLADVVIGATRDIPNFEEWLKNKEILGYFLTRRQWETGRALINQVPKSVIGHISNMFWQSAGLLPENQ